VLVSVPLTTASSETESGVQHGLGIQDTESSLDSNSVVGDCSSGSQAGNGTGLSSDQSEVDKRIVQDYFSVSSNMSSR
jgi:hypothetical protein